MRVLIAGGSGTIGIPLVRALVKAGHDVTALTRTQENVSRLRTLGASAAVVDALDADALTRVVVTAKPTHVVHQLTALPKAGIRRARELEPTNRLRIDGTRNLIAASVAAGAKRIVVGSFAPLHAEREGVPPDVQRGVDAVRSMESQTLDASRRGLIEGVVLRYGFFYGSSTPMTEQLVSLVRRRMLPVVRGDRSLLPFIHLDDAVSATVAALERARAGETYDIVDNEPVSMTDMVVELADRVGAGRPLTVPSWLPRLLSPFMARITSIRLSLSNAKARDELGWQPAFPTYREGLRELLRQAA